MTDTSSTDTQEELAERIAQPLPPTQGFSLRDRIAMVRDVLEPSVPSDGMRRLSERFLRTQGVSLTAPSNSSDAEGQ